MNDKPIDVKAETVTQPVSLAEMHRRKKFSQASKVHGCYKTPEYQAWLAMRQRCSNSKNPAYKHYGGRGIAVSTDWENFESFHRDMGPRPSRKHWIERRNNSLGYERGNCYWATPPEQLRNTRRTIRITIGDQTKCLKDWAAYFKTPYSAVQSRLRRGWLPIRALMDPIQTQFRRLTV